MQIKISSCGKVCKLRENKFIRKITFQIDLKSKSNVFLPQEIDQKFIDKFHQQMNIRTRAFSGSILTPQNNKTSSTVTVRILTALEHRWRMDKSNIECPLSDYDCNRLQTTKVEIIRN